MRSAFFVYTWLFLLLATCPNAEAQLNLLKKKKQETDTHKTYYELKGESFLGVAPFLESSTGIVRSFAVYELLREYPIRINGQTLTPTLVNYPFAAPYAVFGSIENNRAKLKLYINGKKIAEESAPADMAGIYTAITKGLSAQGDADFNPAKVKIDEGDADEVPQKSINQLLPGDLSCRVPEDTIINIFKQLQSMETFKSDDPYEAAKEVKGRFGAIDESEINFFKWREVPYNLKDVARKLIYPRSAGMGPALTYIASGNQLYNAGDGQAAVHCYIGAIGTSKDLLASPFEASAIRYVAFRELAKIYAGPNEARTKTAELYRMLSAAHLSYLNHPVSKKEHTQYYNAINEIGLTLREAESKAQSQRTERTFALINSGLTMANSMTATITGNQAAAGIYKSNAEKGFLETMQLNSTRTDQLRQKYNDYDKKVDATSFRLSDGTNFDQGKPITPNEITYLLIKTPETVQSILNDFAADKPNLKKVLSKYYQSKSDSDLGALFQYFTDYEMKVVNYECRGMTLPSTVVAAF